MDRHILLAAAITAIGVAPALAADVIADPDFPCEGFCAQYNEAQEPFKIFGDTYYVGTTRLTALLIDTGDGLILLDGGFPAAATVIADNIAALGYAVEDIALIGNSHTHIDHVGVIDALQKASGAPVAASPAAADAMERGHAMPNDPQYRDTEGYDYPPVSNIRRVSDGETITVGDTALTAVFTPGHTPGGTSWTWEECEDGECMTVVYADSLNPISNDTFRYSDNPDYLDAFRTSIARVAAMECDIAIVPHPELVGLLDKAARINEDGDNPFADPMGCARYAEMFAENLGRRLAQEEADQDQDE